MIAKPLSLCALLLLGSCGSPSEERTLRTHPVEVIGGWHQDLGVVGLTGARFTLRLRNHAATALTVARFSSSCGCATVKLGKGDVLPSGVESTFDAVVSIQPSQSRTLNFRMNFEEIEEPLLFSVGIRGADFSQYSWNEEHELGGLELHRPHALRLAVQVPEEDREELARLEPRWRLTSPKFVRILKTGVHPETRQFYADLAITPQHTVLQGCRAYLKFGEVEFPFYITWTGTPAPLVSEEAVILEPGADPRGRTFAGSFVVRTGAEDRPRVLADSQEIPAPALSAQNITALGITAQSTWSGDAWNVRLTADRAWARSRGAAVLSIETQAGIAKITAAAGIAPSTTEQTEPLAPARAQAILLRSLRSSLRRPVSLEYRHKAEFEDGTSRSSHWLISGTLEKFDSRETRRENGEIVAVRTTKAGSTIHTTHSSRGWVAAKERAQRSNLRNPSCPLQRCYFGLNSMSIVDMLVDHPPVEAWRTPEGIRVVLPIVQDLEEKIASRRVAGFIGWEATFVERDGSYVLQRVRDLETPKVFDPDGTRTLVDHAQLASTPVESLLAGLEVIATDVTEFSDFITVGGLTLPLRLTHRTRHVEGHVAIDLASVVDRRGTIRADEFEFSVPAGFGTTGRFFDKESGELRYHGEWSGQESQALETMLAKGRALVDQPSGTAQERYLWGIGGGLSCLLGLIVMMRSRRRAGAPTAA